MDHGKIKYEGPFSKEQVEDVKVFLRILKVLFYFGPAFLMDVATTASILKHAPIKTTLHNISESVTGEFLDYGILSPLLTVVCIPVYLSIIRPFFSRCLPNILTHTYTLSHTYALSHTHLCSLSHTLCTVFTYYHGENGPGYSSILHFATLICSIWHSKLQARSFLPMHR